VLQKCFSDHQTQNWTVGSAGHRRCQGLFHSPCQPLRWSHVVQLRRWSQTPGCGQLVVGTRSSPPTKSCGTTSASAQSGIPFPSELDEAAPLRLLPGWCPSSRQGLEPLPFGGHFAPFGGAPLALPLPSISAPGIYHRFMGTKLMTERVSPGVSSLKAKRMYKIALQPMMTIRALAQHIYSARASKFLTRDAVTRQTFLQAQHWG
jgi:hypothetical protein